MSEAKIRIVTPKQLSDGYKIFHINEIPNVTEHKFTVIRKLPDGNYVVKEPEATE